VAPRGGSTCTCPYDERYEDEPQDDSFLEREVWDLKNTPKD
jgi:alpha,alpha-trehalose phosphorylase